MSAVPVGPGTNIGHSCMFLGSLIRGAAWLAWGFGTIFALYRVFRLSRALSKE